MTIHALYDSHVDKQSMRQPGVGIKIYSLHFLEYVRRIFVVPK